MALTGQKIRGENFLATSRAIFTFKGGRGNAVIAEDEASTRAIEVMSSVTNICIIVSYFVPAVSYFIVKLRIDEDLTSSQQTGKPGWKKKPG